MGDRAPVHITIGGALPREHLAAFAAHAADYDRALKEYEARLREQQRYGNSSRNGYSQFDR